MRLALLGLAVSLIIGSPSQARATECRDIIFEGLSFTICETRPARDRIEVFHADADGEVLGSFDAIEEAAAPRGVILAMNAGMYHPDRSPVGHLVIDGEERMRVIASAGPGNFGLLPNGVFCIEADRARVIETLRYQDAPPVCTYATQSGPMLVIDGELHPRFLPESESRFVRNGVGTDDAGTRAVFVISNQPVTFHQFARVFRDELGLDQALYFDGRVSRLHAPGFGRSDPGFAMGPIVAVLD